MVAEIKIGKLNTTFVFKHKWLKSDLWTYNIDRRYYKIGVWFKLDKIVGEIEFNNPKNWSKNLVNNYMLGINLIIIEFWIEFNIGGKIFKKNRT